MVWQKYRQKYGSLHWGMRLDRSMARFTALFANFKAGRQAHEWRDFSPYDAAIEDNRELTNSEVFDFLASMAQGK